MLYNITNHALTQVAPAESGATLVIAAGSNGRRIGRPPVSPCSEAGRSEVAMGEAMVTGRMAPGKKRRGGLVLQR